MTAVFRARPSSRIDRHCVGRFPLSSPGVGGVDHARFIDVPPVDSQAMGVSPGEA
ncbi:MAG TPA: hypothetical protein VF463_19530 [Sphingobium sp.]